MYFFEFFIVFNVFLFKYASQFNYSKPIIFFIILYMDYKDYQILSDNEYLILSEHFNESQTFDRRTSVNKIYSLLNDCKNSCLTLDKNINKKIKDSISDCHNTIEKNINNLSATFNLQQTSKNSESFSLFPFIEKLLEVQSQLLTWSKNEDKEYYAKLCNSIAKEINQSVINVISSISKSNIILFKYM